MIYVTAELRMARNPVRCVCDSKLKFQVNASC